ncbi:MAG TPA: hypothetical protein VE175_15415 [Woeseiaceae bacterium]|nr:hypothetical protein [Woeseiaceae bacterium]
MLICSHKGVIVVSPLLKTHAARREVSTTILKYLERTEILGDLGEEICDADIAGVAFEMQGP